MVLPRTPELDGSTDALIRRLLHTMALTQERMLQTVKALADEIQNAPDEFSIPFRPFFRLGDLVRVIRQGATDDVLITYASSLGNFRRDLGQISARNDGNEVTGLDLGIGRMSQMRFSPITEFEVEVNSPQGIEQGRASTQRYRILPWLDAPGISANEAAFREMSSQFWVWENDTPRFNLIPLVNSAAHQLEAYIDFFGWMYDFTKVGDLAPAEKVKAQTQIADGNFRVFRLNGRP